MKKLTLVALAVGVLGFSTVSSAAGYSTGWSTGTSNIQGWTRGSSVTNFNQNTRVLGKAANSYSYDYASVHETTYGTTRGRFGMSSNFSTDDLIVGSAKLSTRNEFGSGWSRSVSNYDTTGHAYAGGIEVSWVGDYSAGAISVVDYTSHTDYNNRTKVKANENYEFGTYTVTAGIE